MLATLIHEIGWVLIPRPFHDFFDFSGSPLLSTQVGVLANLYELLEKEVVNLFGLRVHDGLIHEVYELLGKPMDVHVFNKELELFVIGKRESEYVSSLELSLELI